MLHRYRSYVHIPYPYRESSCLLFSFSICNRKNRNYDIVRPDFCCHKWNYDKRCDMRTGRYLYWHALNKYYYYYAIQSYSIYSTSKKIIRNFFWTWNETQIKLSMLKRETLYCSCCTCRKFELASKMLFIPLSHFRSYVWNTYMVYGVG